MKDKCSESKQETPSPPHGEDLPPVVSAVQSVPYEVETLYMIDATEEEEHPVASSYVPPFQFTNEQPALPVASPSSRRAEATPPLPGRSKARSILPLPVIGVLVAVVVVLCSLLFPAFAPYSAPAAPSVLVKADQVHQQQPPKATPTITQARQAPTQQINAQAPSPGELPSLPAAWTNANLATGDALFAERTALAFTDREMSFDYRSSGTRVMHAGTFTAAKFILTPNAQARYVLNDIRVINNTLFDAVQQEQRIQAVISPHPQLVKFVVSGQHQLAWIDVAFFLWQSKLNTAGQRTEGFDSESAPGQPRLHHMTALLIRVPPTTQGENPAMGGTGWLVSTYGLDLPSDSALQMVQPA